VLRGGADQQVPDRRHLRPSDRFLSRSTHEFLPEVRPPPRQCGNDDRRGRLFH
jgi:hypothetical protein